MAYTTLPAHGRSRSDVLAAMQAARDHDVRWREGRVFSLVFNAGDEVSDLLKDAYTLFFSENGLNPTAFPSLKKFETEVVAMVASLLGGAEGVVGNLTTGGTESLLLAVLTAREWARRAKPHITSPAMVLPASAHPAFEKAAHYFGVKSIRVPVRSDFRADPAAMAAAVMPDTILMVGSAPSYPHGLVDPIRELASIARQRDLLCHVDACVGGLMLPFVRKLGYPVPDFDLSVPGVTSLSADLHKYGYAAKGASVILYQDAALRRHQYFAYTDWSGGIYASPSMTGTRAGGPIAAAWAILNYLGEDGYLRLTDQVMTTARRLRDGVNAIDGLHVIGQPEMTVMAIGSDQLDVYEVGDELTARGWHLDRQQFPPSLHLTVSPYHAQIVDVFLRDLNEAAAAARKFRWGKTANRLVVRTANLAARKLPAKWISRLTSKTSSLVGASGEGLPSRSAPMYGLMGTLPNRGDLHEVVIDLLDQLTKTPPDKM